jgi:hypothetical protein
MIEKMTKPPLKHKYIYILKQESLQNRTTTTATEPWVVFSYQYVGKSLHYYSGLSLKHTHSGSIFPDAVLVRPDNSFNKYSHKVQILQRYLKSASFSYNTMLEWFINLPGRRVRKSSFKFPLFKRLLNIK